MKSHLTMADVSKSADYDTAFNQFLDDFRREPASTRGGLVAEEPSDNGDVTFMCKLAATAEQLCNDHSIAAPEWASKQKYVAPAPAYGAPRVCARSGESREWFRGNSPRAFATRNLFYGPGLLQRRWGEPGITWGRLPRRGRPPAGSHPQAWGPLP